MKTFTLQMSFLMMLFLVDSHLIFCAFDRLWGSVMLYKKVKCGIILCKHAKVFSFAKRQNCFDIDGIRKMKKLLWISPYVPYDLVTHAGGKTHNYYVKYFKIHSGYDIHLVSLGLKQEKMQFDLERYNISADIGIVDQNMLQSIWRVFCNMNSVFNPNHPLGHTILTYQYHMLLRLVKKYAKKQTPDIVIMQWTGAGMLLNEIKKLFQGSYTVIIEEDVSFLGMLRYSRLHADQKKYFKQYQILKARELEMLNKTDLVVVNNQKDADLLVENGISSHKIYTAMPYYDDYSDVKRLFQENKSRDLLFYGSMEREENHLSVMWFIEHVMPKLQEEKVRLFVVGNQPRPELLQQQNEYIRVEGFVKDVKPYFSRAVCMVAPLKLGAGVKIKILEGLSAGLPVLTNDIGIEGIPAKDGVEYLHCHREEDYVNNVKNLIHHDELAKSIGEAARRFMQSTYNIDLKLDGLIKRIEKES